MTDNRWIEIDGVMKPVINFIHVIPIETRLIHCATLTCWCSPVHDTQDPVIVLHHAVSTPEQWVLIGERTKLEQSITPEEPTTNVTY